MTSLSAGRLLIQMQTTSCQRQCRGGSAWGSNVLGIQRTPRRAPPTVTCIPVSATGHLPRKQVHSLQGSAPSRFAPPPSYRFPSLSPWWACLCALSLC